MPVDRQGENVMVGTLVRIVRLDERGLHGLHEDERADAQSMIDETFEVCEVDDYGRPCVMKRFQGDTEDSVKFHEIALDPDEFEIVREA